MKGEEKRGKNRKFIDTSIGTGKRTGEREEKGRENSTDMVRRYRERERKRRREET
jgi:hypothetical protein